MINAITGTNEEIIKLAKEYQLTEEQVLGVYDNIIENSLTNQSILNLTNDVLDSASEHGRTLKETLSQYELAQQEVINCDGFNPLGNNLEYVLRETFLRNMEENTGLFGELVIPFSQTSGEEFGNHIAKYFGN